ncbi:MAG: tripartite tricarboxylate transporter substrate binding protein [Piscinibacter sp.]
MNKRTLLLSSASAAALWAAAPLNALAQAGGEAAPLRIVLAVPPGGASDAAARLLAQALARSLGQPVLVDNKPGGNGVPAVQAVLTAPPDGRTLLWAMASMTGMPLIVKSPPVRSMNEFTPVVAVMNVAYGVFVNPKVPATTVAELTAHLRANPDKLSYGTGVLSEYMVTAHYLRSAGLKAVRVPYKGGAQLVPDLINGELQFNIGPLAATLPHVRSGKLRLLATLPDRLDMLPGVPSLAEAGVATDTVPTWNGLVAPPGTPQETAARLAQEVNRALADPTLRAALEGLGLRVLGGTPQQMAQAIESAGASWRQFVHDHEIVPE